MSFSGSPRTFPETFSYENSIRLLLIKLVKCLSAIKLHVAVLCRYWPQKLLCWSVLRISEVSCQLLWTSSNSFTSLEGPLTTFTAAVLQLENHVFYQARFASPCLSTLNLFFCNIREHWHIHHKFKPWKATLFLFKMDLLYIILHY